MTDLLFWGGLIGMGAAVLLLLILIPVFGLMRRRLIKKIENGEE